MEKQKNNNGVEQSNRIVFTNTSISDYMQPPVCLVAQLDTLIAPLREICLGRQVSMEKNTVVAF